MAIGKQDWIGLVTTKPAVPGAAARSSTFTGEAADMLGADDGQCCIKLTGTATATAIVTVQESDDGSTGWATIAAVVVTNIANQLGSGLSIPISATETIYEGNFQKSKRYLRAIITGSGHSLAGIFLGNKKYLGS